MSALGNEFGLAWGLPQIIFLFVAAQRVVELGIAKHNAAWLLSEGGTELGAGHYPLFVLLHEKRIVARAQLGPALAHQMAGVVLGDPQLDDPLGGNEEEDDLRQAPG